jgi:hypothetical protein
MRLQSAIEFLITYGWAITIIAIALFALFASGYFNPSNYSGQECAITSGFSCLNFYMPANGMLFVNLQQSLSNPINITSLGCNENGSIAMMQKPYNPSYPSSNQIFMSIGSNYTFGVACYAGASRFSSNPGTVFSGVLLVNYTDEVTKLPGTAVGRVIVKVT